MIILVCYILLIQCYWVRDLITELRSLLEGIRRCHQFDFSRVEIELNSQLIVSWITKCECNIWSLEDF